MVNLILDGCPLNWPLMDIGMMQRGIEKSLEKIEDEGLRLCIAAAVAGVDAECEDGNSDEEKERKVVEVERSKKRKKLMETINSPN